MVWKVNLAGGISDAGQGSTLRSHVPEMGLTILLLTDEDNDLKDLFKDKIPEVKRSTIYIFHWPLTRSFDRWPLLSNLLLNFLSVILNLSFSKLSHSQISCSTSMTFDVEFDLSPLQFQHVINASYWITTWQIQWSYGSKSRISRIRHWSLTFDLYNFASLKNI